MAEAEPKGDTNGDSITPYLTEYDQYYNIIRADAEDRRISGAKRPFCNMTESPVSPSLQAPLIQPRSHIDQLRDQPMSAPNASNGQRLGGAARRTLGICLLLVVVFLWTTSNFLASTIFADNTYSKPFFLTYLNTSCFVIPLLAILVSRTWKLWRQNKLSQIASWKSLLGYLDSSDPEAEEQAILYQEVLNREEGDEDDIRTSGSPAHQNESSKLGLKSTAKLSLQFCILWANYFSMACLQHTSVGSTTIITSTSGVWTMIFGAIARVEKFTVRKLMGVIASLIGIILISRVDLTSSSNDSGNGNGNSTFPHKPAAEVALGDAMAAFSAAIYGVYTIVMKKQIGDESQVNMSLFFGLVGFFNMVLIWPGFIIMHFTGLEKFELPPTNRVWSILLINSVSSLVSDIVWAYAMLLTTPLVVTVGLCLNIPLSLVGQIFLQAQYASAMYWVGAAIVVFSFVFINYESKEGDTGPSPVVEAEAAAEAAMPMPTSRHGIVSVSGYEARQ